MITPVTVTRVINPCALIELGEDAVLTDPYFTNHVFFPMHEPIGLAARDLPALRAILGGHGVFDHWQPRSMADYKHRSTTPVFVATASMARRARRAGFEQVEVLGWSEHRTLSADLTVTCVAGERAMGGRTNNYVLHAPGVSVFVGTEANRIEPIERYA